MSFASSPTRTRTLTDKQERFCQELQLDHNATQAAIRAGYKKDNADAVACQLLKKPQVAARVQELKNRRRRRYEITQSKVLKELAKIGLSNITDYVSFNESGVTMKESSQLSRNQTAAISEVSQVMNQFGGTTKFKLHDKTKALELLGKHLGLFPNKMEHSVDSRLEDLIAGSMGGAAKDKEDETE